jgi:hypothetical protein
VVKSAAPALVTASRDYGAGNGQLTTDDYIDFSDCSIKSIRSAFDSVIFVTAVQV